MRAGQVMTSAVPNGPISASSAPMATRAMATLGVLKCARMSRSADDGTGVFTAVSGLFAKARLRRIRVRVPEGAINLNH